MYPQNGSILTRLLRAASATGQAATACSQRLMKLHADNYGTGLQEVRLIKATRLLLDGCHDCYNGYLTRKDRIYGTLHVNKQAIDQSKRGVA